MTLSFCRCQLARKGSLGEVGALARLRRVNERNFRRFCGDRWGMSRSLRSSASEGLQLGAIDRSLNREASGSKSETLTFCEHKAGSNIRSEVCVQRGACVDSACEETERDKERGSIHTQRRKTKTREATWNVQRYRAWRADGYMHTVRQVTVTPTFLLFSELISDYTYTAGALK